MSIPSPCISVCRMSPSLAERCGEPVSPGSQGVCEGCFRTIDEIIAWGTVSDLQRMQIWQRLALRAQRAGCDVPALPQGVR